MVVSDCLLGVYDNRMDILCNMTSAPRLGPDRIPLIVALTSWFWLTAVNVRHGTCRDGVSWGVSANGGVECWGLWWKFSGCEKELVRDELLVLYVRTQDIYYGVQKSKLWPSSQTPLAIYSRIEDIHLLNVLFFGGTVFTNLNRDASLTFRPRFFFLIFLLF